MSQIWALTTADGPTLIRYTASAQDHPSDVGHAEECEGRNCWPLAQEPRGDLGEAVDHQTGQPIFLLETAQAILVPFIKECAQEAILEFAPIWRQINDSHEQTTPAAITRRERINAIRQYSDQLETRLASASGVLEALSVRSDAMMMRGGILPEIPTE